MLLFTPPASTAPSATSMATPRRVPRLVADEEPGLVVLLKGSAVCVGRGQACLPLGDRQAAGYFADPRFSRRHLLLCRRQDGLWRASAGRTARPVFLISSLDGSRRRVPEEGGEGAALFDGDVLLVELSDDTGGEGGKEPWAVLLRYSLRVLDIGLQRGRPEPAPHAPTGLEAAQSAFRSRVLAELGEAMKRVELAATHEQVLEAAGSVISALGQAQDSYNRDANAASQEPRWGSLPLSLLRAVLKLVPSVGGLDSALGVCHAWREALPGTAPRRGGAANMGLRYSELPGRRVKWVQGTYCCKEMVADVRTRPLWRDELTGEPVDITVVSRGPRVRPTGVWELTVCVFCRPDGGRA